MAGVGRNAPCGCGSGKKTKWCCGLQRGPGPDGLAKAFLADQRRLVAERLVGLSRDEFEELFHEMVHLPELDVSLQVELPALVTPELARARAALDDPDDFDAYLGPLVGVLDSPARRAGLARAVLALVAADRIDPDVGAVAIFDLNRAESALFISSVAEAVGVDAGAAQTPGGLVLAG